MTNENHTRRIWRYYFGPSTLTRNKRFGPQFGKTVYISEVKGDRKVISNAQVTINKNSDSRAKIVSSGGGWEWQFPNSNFSKFLELSCLKQVELGSLHDFTIDTHRTDLTDSRPDRFLLLIGFVLDLSSRLSAVD